MGHPDGATYRHVVYDLLRDFKQRYSQASISEYQMLYWVMVHADRLRKQHIQKIDSGEYLVIYPSVAVTTDASDHKYFDLPARIYDYDLDKGISYISFIQGSGESSPAFTTQTFGRTTPAQAQRLSFREEETPSSDNPYFYRVGDEIHLLGVEDITLEYVEIGIYQSLNPADLNLDIDQPFDFPQDLIPVLKRQVLDLGLFVLNVPADLKNDGRDGQGEVPQKKFISVSDMNVNDQKRN